MKVRYTRTALRELDEIFSHVATQNPRAAAAVVARVEQIVGWIADFPRMGYLVEGNVRFLPLGRYPFLVFYAVHGDEIIIRNVRHAARRRT